jgi:hypothetical protein
MRRFPFMVPTAAMEPSPRDATTVQVPAPQRVPSRDRMPVRRTPQGQAPPVPEMRAAAVPLSRDESRVLQRAAVRPSDVSSTEGAHTPREIYGEALKTLGLELMGGAAGEVLGAAASPIIRRMSPWFRNRRVARAARAVDDAWRRQHAAYDAVDWDYIARMNEDLQYGIPDIEKDLVRAIQREERPIDRAQRYVRNREEELASAFERATGRDIREYEQLAEDIQVAANDAEEQRNRLIDAFVDEKFLSANTGPPTAGGITTEWLQPMPGTPTRRYRLSDEAAAEEAVRDATDQAVANHLAQPDVPHPILIRSTTRPPRSASEIAEAFDLDLSPRFPLSESEARAARRDIFENTRIPEANIADRGGSRQGNLTRLNRDVMLPGGSDEMRRLQELLAKNLGVEPDVLRAARVRHARERAAGDIEGFLNDMWWGEQ